MSVRSITLYALASVVSGASGLIAIPILLSILGIDSFGRWGLLEPILVLLSQTVLMGANFAIFEALRTTGLSPGLVSSAWLKRGIAPVVSAIPVIVIACWIAGWPTVTALLIWVAVCAEGALLLMQSAARAAGLPASYLLGNIIRAVPWLAGLAVLNASGASSLTGVLSIRAIAAGTTTIFYLLRMRVRASVEEKIVPPLSMAIRYGFPITLSAALVPLGEVLERSILALVISFSAAGTYFVAVKYVAVLNLGLLSPIGLWWPRERAQLRSQSDGGQAGFARIQRIVPIVCALIATVFILCSKIALPILAPHQKSPPDLVITLLVYAGLLRGMTPLLSPGAMEQGSTWMSGASTGLSVIVLIPLCYIFGGAYGLSGFAVANFVSACIGTISLVMLGTRSLAIRGVQASLIALLALIAAGAGLVMEIGL